MKKLLFLTALLLVLVLPLNSLAASVVLDNNISFSAGLTTIRWSGDIPEGGFNVLVAAVNPYESATLFQAAGNEIKGHSVTTGYMAPGKTYEVYVTDSSYHILGVETYTVPDVPVFEDGKLKSTSVKISTELRRGDADLNYKKIKSFKASEMTSALSAGKDYFYMKYQMRMPQLIRPRTFFVQLVFETPNGYTYVDKAKDITFDKVSNGYQTVWWDAAGFSFFDDLLYFTDSIPSGRYTMTLYWDGCFVNTSTFTVE